MNIDATKNDGPTALGNPPTGDAVIFDIETGPLPVDQMPPFDASKVKYGNTKDAAKRAVILEKAEANHIEKAALSPLTGRVVAVGYYRATRVEEGNPGASITGMTGAIGESFVLKQFWRVYREAVHGGQSMVGHNIHGFDLPFLIKRSWINGVLIPESVLTQGRYWADTFIDTMKVWACGDYSSKYTSLNDLAQAFGVGSKADAEGCTGADFSRLWFGSEEEMKLAVKYLENDLRMTGWVAFRVGAV